MVNVVVDPLSDHVGYHILHWIVSQSGAWYSKVNENLQDNLRSLETGVAVIDDILTPKEEENPYENQQRVEAEDNRFDLFHHNSNEHHINILNQIINMNINYNEGSNDRQIRGTRRRPSGEFLIFHNFSSKNIAPLITNLAHMLVEFSRAFNSPFSLHIDFSNSLCFVCGGRERKDGKTNSFALNHGDVEFILENYSNETQLGADQHVLFANALDQR